MENKTENKIEYKNPALVDSVDDHLQKVGQIRNDELALYIGIGSHKDGVRKGDLYMEWKVMGKNKSAGLIGQKLLSIINPLIHNFLTYDFDEWAKINLPDKEQREKDK